MVFKITQKREMTNFLFSRQQLLLKNDSIYYITWPERDFCCCGFNGNNAKVLIEKANPIVWSFPEYDNLLISFSDYYTYYIYDIETNMVDYDHPFKMEQVMGQ